MQQHIQAVLSELNRVILGKEEEIQLAVCCLLAKGHLLIEDLPGMGKTTLAHALATVMGLDYQRVQFTSDMLPADLLGVSVFEQQKEFVFHPGPVFTQVLLADEINRGSPRTQSALLEAMAERCQRHGVRVISDEIHMDMVWGEQPHIPWSNVARGDWALLTSGSKSFNIPALTGAYGIIENSSSRDAYLSALKGRDGLSSPSVLALTAHIAAYQQGAPWLDALRVYLKDNLTYIADKMNAAFPELNWQIPQSTYLAWLDLRPLNIDDNALQKALIEQEKIAIMPGYTYGEEGRGFVRLNAGCPRSKLEKGVAGLINAIRAVR